MSDTTAYVDDTRIESKQFFYRIKARNTAGLASRNFSNEVSATTAPDLLPPEVTAISSYGRPDHLAISFNERVEKASAETSTNYQITPDVAVSSALIALDSMSVILTTSPMAENISYSLTITQVQDLALFPNTIIEPEVVSFFHKPFLPNLVAAWDFDASEGTILTDYSGNMSNGILHNGLRWAGGQSGNGLLFDGIDDYAEVPASPSLAVAPKLSAYRSGPGWLMRPMICLAPMDRSFDSESDNYVLV